MFTPVLQPVLHSEPGPDVDTGDGWAQFGLQPTLKWPMQLIFPPAVVAKYNSLLQFFLRVSRVQWSLQQTWLMGQKNSVGERQTAVLPRVWSLRSRMSHLVDNLQYYLKIDVLEAQYTQLLDTVGTIRDFDSFRVAHAEYLSQLLIQTFRNGAGIRRIVADLFGLCMAFCTLMQKGGPGKEVTGYAELERIEVAFERQAGFLFKVLSSVAGKVLSGLIKLVVLKRNATTGSHACLASSQDVHASTICLSCGNPPLIFPPLNDVTQY
jgi:gamma-tubulin complex component 4